MNRRLGKVTLVLCYAYAVVAAACGLFALYGTMRGAIARFWPIDNDGWPLPDEPEWYFLCLTALTVPPLSAHIMLDRSLLLTLIARIASRVLAVSAFFFFVWGAYFQSNDLRDGGLLWLGFTVLFALISRIKRRARLTTSQKRHGEANSDSNDDLDTTDEKRRR